MLGYAKGAIFTKALIELSPKADPKEIMEWIEAAASHYHNELSK